MSDLINQPTAAPTRKLQFVHLPAASSSPASLPALTAYDVDLAATWVPSSSPAIGADGALVSVIAAYIAKQPRAVTVSDVHSLADHGPCPA
jgi:hypothetical protein